MQEWDRAVIEKGTPSLELMDRAAKGLFDAVIRMRTQEETVTILIGSGNNGGDGAALAVRLQKAGVPVRLISVGNPEKFMAESAHYWKLAKALGVPIASEWQQTQNELLVDAMFGVGLNRPITGRYAELIDRMNQSHLKILSADLPSGLDANTGAILGTAVCATETVSMQFPKIGMLLGKGPALCGRITVCLLSDESVPPIGEPMFWQEPEDIVPLLPPRPFDSHKGKNGHALLCAGSKQYIGAALLCAKAALRTGCGLLSVCTPDAVRPAFGALPEAITIPTGTEDWNEQACKSATAAIDGKQAIGIGCGIGSGNIGSLLSAALQSRKPLVIDADGLNALAKHPELLSLLHENVVLTPHPGEMARLMGCSTADVLADPIKASRLFPCTTLLKGATTIVHGNGSTLFCTEGTPALSKGGSGDVLTGLITALLAQGLSPFDAARTGTYLLGTTAKEAYRLLGERMLLASDVIDAL